MVIGNLDKMKVFLQEGVAHYEMSLSDSYTPMNPMLGKKVALYYLDEINCCHCHKKTKKSYGGGYCYPCTLKLAECDMCILKPELCHFQKGTCRDTEFAKSHCFIDHVVYLSNTSGLKVGITRVDQVPTRFIDQGAVFALPIFKIKTRYHSGLIEKLLSQVLKDKTDWRKMLKNEWEEIDLYANRMEIFEEFSNDLDRLEKEYENFSVEYLENEKLIEIKYPVLQFPTKVNSLSFEKNKKIEGTLLGIKGQYLILENGVINIRNHTGYKIEMEI